MAIPDHDSIPADAFLRWVVTRQGRFELVDGCVVRMMAGAKQAHNVVTSKIAAALASQAKRRGCRTTSSDTAVRTGPASVRFPDVVVDGGPRDPSAMEATQPTLVIEVSSPGTSTVDATDKLDEYQRHKDIALIVLVDPDIVSVKVYRRAPGPTWRIEKYDDLDQTVHLPEVGASLSLRDISDTLEPEFRPRLRLVDEERNSAADYLPESRRST